MMPFKNAHTFDPVQAKDFPQINAALKHNRLSEIPDAYMTFLSKTNGLIFRDWELYGTLSQILQSRFFSFPDIVGYNRRYMDYPFFIQKLIFGQNSSFFVVYDAQQNKYMLCDRMSFQPMDSFETLDALLKIIMID